MFFPGRKFRFWYTQNKFPEKLKKKKKKKKNRSSPPHLFLLLFLLPFYYFSYFHFQFSTFPFTIFLLFFSIFTPFPLFSFLFLPDTSAKISRSEVSGGHSAQIAPPPACYATAWNVDNHRTHLMVTYHMNK